MKKNYRKPYKKRKIKQYNKTNLNKTNNYVNNLISRLLIAIILFFGILIYTTDSKNLKQFKKYFVESHLSFSKINKIYSKYLGSPLPISKTKSVAVFKENSGEKLKEYGNGYVKENKNKSVTALKEGIVVKVSNTKKFGKTIIIQGIDEIDYTYAFLDDISVKLYDYVGRDANIGTTKEKVYLAFKKKNIYLKYEELPKN